MNGILVINKEKDYTSRDVVNKISKILNIKKIGHTGTLDPIATGVLVLCIGNATKLVEILTCYEKEYIAEVVLGIETDTLDITGNILKEETCLIEKEKIKEVLNSMIGSYQQEVPIYSAVKINGMKLYQYARNNQSVILPKREVMIASIEMIDDIIYENNKTIFKFKTTVSKGTYIRSLIRDIAFKLNTIGIMRNLQRTKQGKFNIEDSYTISDIENNKYRIIDAKDCLTGFYKVIADEELQFKIRNGQILDNLYNKEEVLFVDNIDKPLSIYKTYEKDNTKIKPWKMF